MSDIRVGIKLTTDGSGKVTAEITQVKKGLEETGRAAETAASKNKKAADDTSKAYAGLASQLDSVKKAALGYLSVQAAMAGSRAILDATVQMERLKGMMEAASGSAAASVQNLRFVDQTAKALGINLSAAAEGFANLSAAAQGTALAGQATRDIFTAVAKASAALGKSSADTLSMIQALGQMISKGTVSMEELRGQLGDRLPGAFQIAARAMGMTTQELDKLIASGQLTADEFLPKLAKALDATYSSARFDRLNNQLERLDNAWTKLKANILDSDAMARAAGNLANALERFGADTGSALDKTRERIIELRKELAELEQQMAKPWWQRPVDISIMAPGKIEELKKEISGLENRAGGLEKQEIANQYNEVAKSADVATKSLKGLSEIQSYIYQQSVKNKIDPAVMLGLAQRESGFNPNIRSGIPGHGYETTGLGLYQFIPPTGKRYGLNSDEDRRDYKKATDAAMKLMKDLLNTFNGDIRLALAAWNAGVGKRGGKGVLGALSRGIDPDRITEGGHVAAVMGLTNKWRKRLSGMDAGELGPSPQEQQKYTKEWEKAQKDQYDSYVAHLKARESAFEDYSKTALAEQRTMMERLNAAQQDAEQKAKAAMAGGDLTAIRAAEAQQRKFLEDKKALLLQGIAIEEEATRKKIANIGMEIAQAQKLNQYDGVDKLRQQRRSELAELAALAERRKQIEISANADIAKSAIQYEDDRRKAQRQTADDYAQSVAERRQATEEEYRFFQANMDLQIDRAKSLAESRKADIDITLEQAKAQATQADAARQAAMEGKTGMEAIAQARENVNAKLADSLRLIDLEKTATLDKLRIDGDILASQRQLLEVYRAIAEQRGNRDDVLKTEQQLNVVYAAQEKNLRARVQAEMDASGARAKAQAGASGSMGGIDKEAAKANEQSVKEEQLRMNAWWDQYMGRLRDYASLWEQITGKSADGWSQMTLAAGEYQKQFNQIQQYWQSDAGKSWGDLGPMVEVTQQAQAALAGMAKTLLAMRSQYKEGSQGYKDMTIAAERMMEVQRVAAVVEGVMGVLHQLGSGDPYTAPARAAMASAIVAMQLASIGMSSAQVPGFNNRQAREASQAGGSTSAGGGVFGDTSAKSDSIAKSLEIVSQNSSADLAYSAGMLRALTDIKYALMGTTNAVIRNVGPQSGLNLNAGMGTTIARGMLDPIGSSFAIGAKVFGDPLSKLMAKLSQFLLNTTKKITDWGLAATQQSLGDIMKGGFKGQGFTDVTTTTKVLGITVQKSTKRYFAELNGAVNSEFTRAIVAVANTVAEAGKAFGLGAKDFEDRLKNFVVSFGSISTKGLKGEDLQKALSQMFSAMSDDMARAFMPGLDAFMQAGEGYLTTLVRVADGINVATGILEQAGLTAINYQQIVLKQGDVAAEIVRQSIVAFEGTTSAIGAYVDQAVGSAEELMAVYQDLLIISDTAKLAGFNLNNLSNALIVTSGGVSKFLSNLQTYQTEILGSSDYARQMLTLQREFAKIGQAVPANNAAFVKLVNGIDTTTEAGQKLYAQVLALAGAFSKAQQEAAKLEELRNKYLPKDSMAEYRKQLDQVPKDFAQIIEGTLAGMKGGGTYLRRTARITALTDLKTDRQDELAIVNEDIAKLEAKGKLTLKEKQTLAGLRQQRKDLEAEIKDTDAQIAKINKLIEKNKNTGALIKERDKLIEEQGNAIIQTLADIWDKMTAAINAAKETLIGIQNDIYELTFTAGSQDVKLGMATAKRTTAEQAYYGYTGNDIEQLNKYASALHQAIMAEYQAKMDAIMAPKVALEKERDLAQKAHDEQIAALEKQLGISKELFDAVKNIQDYAKSLRVSTAANLSPKKALDAAKAQYEELLQKAQGGDVEAMKKITGASDAYLEAAKKYFGSGGKYGQIFDGIVSAMDALGMTNTGDAQSIQDKIDKLNADHALYLKGIDDKIAALNIDQKVKDLQMSTAADLEKLGKDLGPRITAAEKQAKKDMADLIGKVTEGNTLNAQQVEALNTMLKSWGMNPIAGPAPTKPTEPDLPAPTDDWVQRIFDQWNKGQTGYKAPLPAFAQGGLAQPGWALVGEEGPELVKFGSQAMVYDAEATAKMLREMASFQPVMPQAPRPINLEIMPRLIDDTPKQGKPITMAPMPRVINDLPRRDPDIARLSNDEVIAELRAMRAELKALVTTQSRANPAVIEQLANIERRLGYMERDQKLKPA